MVLRTQLDHSPFPLKGFRLILQCGIAIMLLFCVTSFADVANQPGLVEILSAANDTIFAIVLIAIYVLLARLRLGAAALILAGAIFAHTIANILLFPNSLVRIIYQPLLAVILALAYIDSRRLRVLSIAAWLTIALIFWLSNYTSVSAVPIIDFLALSASSAIILLVLSQFHARMNATLTEAQTANAALEDIRANLETQVGERTASLQQALGALEARSAEQERLLAETEQQRTAIRALSLPILTISQTTLAIPLIGTFDTHRLIALQEQTLQAIERTRAKALVLDITGIPAVDHEVAQGILGVAQSVRLMGASIVLAGIRPEVAQAIVSLGMDLAALQTAATFEEGIAVAAQSSGNNRVRSG